MTSKKVKDDNQDAVFELTADLQRIRADFENYRKQVEREKTFAREAGQNSMIIKMLPVIDNIDRAITHVPENLTDDKWVQGIVSLGKQLDKSLSDLGLVRIDAKPGTIFNPELHEAVRMDEDAEGEMEVIAEELQAGYMLSDRVVRHAMVAVTRN